MSVPDYSPKQVTQALQALARNNGDIAATADELIDDEFMVSRADLAYWQSEHPEQFQQHLRAVMSSREQEAAAKATEIVKEGGDLELKLMREVATIRNPQLMPQALRAITYARSKNTTILMQLTGRPVDGKQDASADAMAAFVQGMAERGLIAIAPEVAATLGPGDVVEETG